MTDKRGFRIPEVVAYSGRPRTAVYEAIRVGELKSYLIGARRLVLREDLDDWLERLTVRAQSAPGVNR